MTTSIDAMSAEKGADRDSRSHILNVAVRLFAERGLDAVSVRDITGTAQVNLGAVNYYFGSKEHLIREIYESLLGPVQCERLTLLDQLEAQAGDDPLDMESVLRALIEPAARRAIGKQEPANYLPRLMFQAYAVSRPFLDDKLSEQSDHVAKRFIDALARTAPGIPREEICWRYYIVIGGFLQLVTDVQGPQRLWRLSDGLCAVDDPVHLIDELVAFFVHGMTAPAPHRTDARKGPMEHF
ncbi:TetR/AcrR family transcriptional regulator [Chelativorans alearense]|uniref:TetR/AcrR family transcriptional regulator n=1 Tax=Chelativorans alearense TaxID=2681495 RepID=UPI0013D83D06|nr:TetR/AcrR family transcriptional regulator [Chelativorans alearense]